MDRDTASHEASAHVALTVPLRYAQAGSSLARAALAGARDFEVLRHYPAADVVDRDSGMRFYYHAHRLDDPEHGHFHLFLDGPQAGAHQHLVALSLDVRGQPLRWFTTNRWVTGEQWRPADELLPALRRFSVRCTGRLAPVARWLTAMVSLYQEELTELLRARDAALDEHLRARPDHSREALFEDRSIDVLSACPALLTTRIAAWASPGP